MTLYDRVIDRAERWIDAIDQERDHLARVLAWEVISEIERAFIPARLAVLEQERVQAVLLLEELRLHQYRPEVMFHHRPAHRMLKVPLRKQPERKRSA